MPDVARVDPDFDQLDALKFVDEDAAIAALLAAPPLAAVERRSVEAKARQIVRQARALKRRKGMMESFLEEFGLSNAEGLALMCLAEALLRVPDAGTADRLIAEKIRSGRWEDHLGKADSWLVNAGTFGLMLTGRLAAAGEELRRDFSGFMGRFVARAGEPVVRAAAMQAMRILGEQFVLGRTIEAAIQRGKGMIRSGAASHFSFDMLGEGARTAADAERYFQSYRHALEAVGADGAGLGPQASSGLSVKLSALHPRYEARCEERVFAELYPKVLSLAVQAREYNVGFCIDAEEADRLALSLKLLARLAHEGDLGGWEGLGLAVK
ncbi:MAG: proline dehydrogenase family protein, partial [Hyphomonadaceae bacterium]|nr:proline dehydrogenase family protein [Hyphomonadaceae bacterium]